jgi:hypothetical protein
MIHKLLSNKAAGLDCRNDEDLIVDQSQKKLPDWAVLLIGVICYQ